MMGVQLMPSNIVQGGTIVPVPLKRSDSPGETVFDFGSGHATDTALPYAINPANSIRNLQPGANNANPTRRFGTGQPVPSNNVFRLALPPADNPFRNMQP